MVNNATLEMKLAGQIAGMKDPGFSLEILAAMAAIGRGQQQSIWNQMKLMLEEWKILCFRRARREPCDMCSYQDTEGQGQDKTQKLFCNGTGMQSLNFAQTYIIVRMKAEDDDHIFPLPHTGAEAGRANRRYEGSRVLSGDSGCIGCQREGTTAVHLEPDEVDA